MRAAERFALNYRRETKLRAVASKTTSPGRTTRRRLGGPRTIIIPPSMKVELNCPALWAGSFTVWEVADSPTPSRKRGFAILSDRLEWP